MKFNKIPKNTFDALQLEAGVVLNKFDPDTGAAPDDADIVTATTGGINVACVPTYEDFGADVDNCPVNMKELKRLTGWECTMSFTGLGTSPELIRWALGAADIDSDNPTHIKPRRDVAQDDFKDIWWVGDTASGGLVAIRLINALSTGGFTLQTTKSGKGNVSITLTGHVSIDDQDTMPMEFYSMDGEGFALLDNSEVPDQKEQILGIEVSKLISADTKIGYGNEVEGTFHYATYDGFSSVPDEKKGHYLPITLKKTGEKMTLKKDGAVVPKKEDIPFDPSIVFRVDDVKTCSVEVDGEEVFVANFGEKAIMEPGE